MQYPSNLANAFEQLIKLVEEVKQDPAYKVLNTKYEAAVEAFDASGGAWNSDRMRELEELRLEINRKYGDQFRTLRKFFGDTFPNEIEWISVTGQDFEFKSDSPLCKVLNPAEFPIPRGETCYPKNVGDWKYQPWHEKALGLPKTFSM